MPAGVPGPRSRKAAAMSSSARTLLALVLAVAGALIGFAPVAAAPALASSSPAAPPAGHYDHVFVVVEENHGFTDVIGNPAAPNLNALASTYGIATNYYAVTHPSEPNYVALLGGSTFTVHSDDAYYVNRVAAPSLISELDHAGVRWKAYLQSLPHPGYEGICYPASCNGAPDKDPLYVSKHNAIGNFTTSLNPADWSRQVPVGQLAGDLRRGTVPAFSWVIPDECHDQHGDPPYCIDSGTPGARTRRISAWSPSVTSTWASSWRGSPARPSGPRATTPSMSSTTRETTTRTVGAGSPTS